MTDMPKLIIDQIPVEVADGVSVLEAAESIGIPIPHFCWHPALGKAGACRVCAVKMLDGPVKGIQMSCMLEVQDGMVVSTTDEEAVAMRRQVIEWLMLNHPHDCPVCDEGGECWLQDMTIAGGHGLRRYTGKKRTHVNQYLGPLIEHEMNRCIQCYRCVRFYQQFAGGTDFGVMGSADRVYFGRAEEGRLQSPFSGNILDLCPTGVFTDKTARFRARYWDYDMAPSVCPHCSLGCNTVPAARYRELLKVVARRNDAVNGWFICDRGRFGNQAVNDPQRPRFPLVDGVKKQWPEALRALRQRIEEIDRDWQPESLAIVGSSRLSLEALSLLHELSAGMTAGPPCYFVDEAEADWCTTAVSHFDRTGSASMADIQEADIVVIVGCRLLDEGPMMALAVRQAWLRGAQIFMVKSDLPSTEREDLPFEWTSVSSFEDVSFEEKKNPIVICGGNGTGCASIFPALSKGAKAVFLFNGPNGFAAALLAMNHSSASLSRAIADKQIRGIIAVEADIPAALLEGRECVAALDWCHTETVAAARIVLPTTAWVEMDGIYINNEGRAQRFNKVMNPGLPIRGLDPALHPPHHHTADVPGGDLRPAWRVIVDIISELGAQGSVEPLCGRWQGLRHLAAEGLGQLVVPGGPSHGREHDT
ncbi:MAG: NADH-quinone oxidoreductase subunit NuoG [Desulforhopalus sp.]